MSRGAERKRLPPMSPNDQKLFEEYHAGRLGVHVTVVRRLMLLAETEGVSLGKLVNQALKELLERRGL